VSGTKYMATHRDHEQRELQAMATVRVQDTPESPLSGLVA
jgi:hypothetical protein